MTKKKRILYSLIISVFIIIIGLILDILILKYIDKVYLLFGSNEFVEYFLNNIAKSHISVSVEMIIFFSILFFLLNYLTIKKKVVFFSINTCLFFVFLIVNFLLLKSNNVYVYQIIINLMESMKLWRRSLLS